MKKLLVLGILLVAALAVADLLAQAYVEDQVEASAESELEGIGGVQSEISSFPFLGRIAFGGEVSHLELVLTDVVGRGIPVAELRLDIDGLRFDRGTLLESNRLRITGVGRVAVVAVVTRDELAEVLGDAARRLRIAGLRHVIDPRSGDRDGMALAAVLLLRISDPDRAAALRRVAALPQAPPNQEITP